MLDPGMICVNPVSIYSAIRTQDTTGGVQYSYATSATATLMCSAQPIKYEEIYEGDRVTIMRHWNLIFDSDPRVRPRDEMIWTDFANATHIGFVQASRDEAGRGLAYSVRVMEKI